MEDEIIDLMVLAGNQSLCTLIYQGFRPSKVIRYAQEKGGKKAWIFNYETAKNQFEKCLKLGISLIPFWCENYPKDLKVIDNPPALLYGKGKIPLLNDDFKKVFGIIGARIATMESLKLAYTFAEELSIDNFTICSGFAHGVDAYACKGALKYGTIQVLGCGLDIIYPKQHSELYSEVLANEGLFISEIPPGIEAKAEHFPLRNRIISGISKGILVVQASKVRGSSGSLITSNLCISQGRYLFAIPGHPGDSRFEGSNNLLKYGDAIFTTTPSDIMDMIGKPKIRSFIQAEKRVEMPNTQDEIKVDESLKSTIKSLLSTNPTSIEELERVLKIDMRTIQTALVELELTCEIQKHYDSKFSLCLI